MPLILYSLLYDADGDAILETDLTSLLLDFQWIEGFPSDYAPVVDPSFIRFKFDNQNNDFTHDSTDFVRNRRIALYATPFQGDETLQFEAVTGDFQPLIEDGQRVCYLQCTRFVENLAAQNLGLSVELSVQTTWRTDELITLILRSAPPSVALTGYFLLDISLLDGDDPLAPDDTSYDVGTGSLTLNYNGGTWQSDTNMLEAIQDITISEYGRFWIARDGKYTWRGRSYLQYVNRTILAELQSSSYRAVKFTYPAQQYRRVTVRSSPRFVGSSLEVLAAITQPIPIRAQRSTTVRLPFINSSGVPISGQNLETPQPSTDYTAFAGGDNVTTSIGVSMEDRGNAAILTLTNNTLLEVEVNFLQVRGIQVNDHQKLDYSQLNVGVPAHWQELDINARLIDDLREIERYVVYVSGFFSEDRAQLEFFEITSDDEDLTELIVGLYLLDRITAEYNGHTAEYFVRKIERRAQWARFWLECADTKHYFFLDDPDSLLDDAVLAW